MQRTVFQFRRNQVRRKPWDSLCTRLLPFLRFSPTFPNANTRPSQSTQATQKMQPLHFRHATQPMHAAGDPEQRHLEERADHELLLPGVGEPVEHQ